MSFYKNVVRGSAWMIVSRWSVRLIGLLSTVILARLLSPADFGVAAIAMMVVAFFDRAFDINAHNVLIREQNADRGFYDSGWTVAILQGGFLALCLVTIAPWVADHFQDQRVRPVLYLIAAAYFARGFQNIGIVDFRKKLDFRRDFQFTLYTRLTTLLFTVAAAAYFRSYWALVVGTVTAYLGELVLSYLMHPFRPRFSLRQWRAYVVFSAWMTPVSLCRFLNNKADVFMVGTVDTIAHVGAYNVGAEVSRMLTGEILAPIGRALYPNLATIWHEPERLAEAFLALLRTVTIVSIALGVGLSVVAEDFVHVLLGAQWEFAVPIVRWLAIAAGVYAVAEVIGGHFLLVTRNERSLFIVTFARTALMVPSVIYAAYEWGVHGIAMATALSTIIYVPIILWMIQRILPVTGGEIVAAVIRPCVASAIMAAAVLALPTDSIDIPALSLIMEVAAGVTVYVLALLALWAVAGRPPGLEGMAVDALIRRFRTRSEN